MSFEAVGGQLHQLRRRRQIPIGGLGVAMSEIGGQQCESRLRVVALAIGVEQRRHSEPMTNIVQPWPTGGSVRPKTHAPHQGEKRVLHVALQQPGAGGGHEQRGGVTGRRSVRAVEILLDRGGGSGMQRKGVRRQLLAVKRSPHAGRRKA